MTETQPKLVLKQAVKVRLGSIFFTIVYSILLLPFIGVALFSQMVFDKPDIGLTRGYIKMFILCLIPISMIISLSRMWPNFSSKQYKRTYFFWALPILVFAAFFLIEASFEFFGY